MESHREEDKNMIVDTCKSCEVEVTKENRGGNYYEEVYCKECWENKRKYVGRSWGGTIDDAGYSL